MKNTNATFICISDLQTIEVFLVKEVTHVVTDRESWQCNKNSPSTPIAHPSSNDSPRPDRSARPVRPILFKKKIKKQFQLIKAFFAV